MSTLPVQLPVVPDVSAKAKDILPPLSRYGDRAFRILVTAMACSLVLLIVLVAYQLWSKSGPTRAAFGWSFLTSTAWDPVQSQYGALPFIVGTLATAAVALVIAVPLGIGTAVFLTELAPLWLRQPLISLVEMLAAIPSVILGLWGVFVMVPFLREGPFQWAVDVFGATPDDGVTLSWLQQLWFTSKDKLGLTSLFSGPIYGVCVLSAGIIVSIMILPIITAVSREILRSVPDLQREACYALGATRWEVTRIAVLSYAKPGLFGAVILGLGRALGETMAVTMVIGNSQKIPKSLLEPADTLASVIANQFAEATDSFQLSALTEIGLVLLGVTLLVNLLAQLLLKFGSGSAPRRA